METLEHDQQKTEGVIKPRAFETQMLYQRLQKAASGDDYSLIPYAELSAVASVDVQSDGRGNLQRARKAIENETGRLFGVVRGEGVKLLTVEEQANEADAAITATRRHTTRKLTRLSRVEFDKLPDAAQERHKVATLTLGMARLFTRAKGQRRLEELAENTARPDVGKTLELFVK